MKKFENKVDKIFKRSKADHSKKVSSLNESFLNEITNRLTSECIESNATKDKKLNKSTH